MKAQYDFSKGKRGAVAKASETKERITIRLDADILTWFRNAVDEAGGGNYQTAMNNALREYIEGKYPIFIEDRMRRILREELDRRPSSAV